MQCSKCTSLVQSLVKLIIAVKERLLLPNFERGRKCTIAPDCLSVDVERVQGCPNNHS